MESQKPPWIFIISGILPEYTFLLQGYTIHRISGITGWIFHQTRSVNLISLLIEDLPQLPDPGQIGIVLRTPPDHMRLLRGEFIQLRPDGGNVIPYLPAIDVKIDATGIGGGHLLFFRAK